MCTQYKAKETSERPDKIQDPRQSQNEVGFEPMMSVLWQMLLSAELLRQLSWLSTCNRLLTGCGNGQGFTPVSMLRASADSDAVPICSQGTEACGHTVH